MTTDEFGVVELHTHTCPTCGDEFDCAGDPCRRCPECLEAEELADLSRWLPGDIDRQFARND